MYIVNLFREKMGIGARMPIGVRFAVPTKIMFFCALSQLMALYYKYILGDLFISHEYEDNKICIEIKDNNLGDIINSAEEDVASTALKIHLLITSLLLRDVNLESESVELLNKYISDFDEVYAKQPEIFLDPVSFLKGAKIFMYWAIKKNASEMIESGYSNESVSFIKADLYGLINNMSSATISGRLLESPSGEFKKIVLEFNQDLIDQADDIFHPADGIDINGKPGVNVFLKDNDIN